MHEAPVFCGGVWKKLKSGGHIRVGSRRTSALVHDLCHDWLIIGSKGLESGFAKTGNVFGADVKLVGKFRFGDRFLLEGKLGLKDAQLHGRQDPFGDFRRKVEPLNYRYSHSFTSKGIER